MKSRSEIWLRALEELGAQCSVNTQRSAKTAADRMTQEGESFFTITLPAFGKYFEQCLRTGSIPDSAFVGWKRSDFKVNCVLASDPLTIVTTLKMKGNGTPKFLGEFLGLVFKSHADVPYTDDCSQLSVDDDDLASFRPDVRDWAFDRAYSSHDFHRMCDAIAAVRQLTLMFSKEKALCADSKVAAAFSQYEAIDQELDAPFVTTEPPSFSKVAGSSGPARSSLSYSDQLYHVWIERFMMES